MREIQLTHFMLEIGKGFNFSSPAAGGGGEFDSENVPRGAKKL